MNKFVLLPLAGIVLAAAPAEAQDVGGILSSILGRGGYSQPSYGYQETYPERSYGDYAYQPTYGYQQSYGYQPAYAYQSRYAYSYRRPRYVTYGYRRYARYRYPRYHHVSYWHHAHRQHYRSYAYAYRRGHRWG